MRRIYFPLILFVVAAIGAVAYAQVPPVQGVGGFFVQVSASSGNVSAATAAATLPAIPGKVTYITAFQMTAGGSTAVSTVTCTVSNVVTGTLSYTFSSALGVDAPSPPLIVEFIPPLPANAPNTTIVASCPALGSGNAHASMSAQGFQR